MDTSTAGTNPLVAALDAQQGLTGWDDHPADSQAEAEGRSDDRAARAGVPGGRTAYPTRLACSSSPPASG
ncbi:hypothetical protein EDD92_9520 [Streptomyces sp. TLI_185]|nr:hypothetical protein EDD92_9520 [Streptomyces sp. TLI_185]